MSIFTNVKNGVVENAKKFGNWAAERKDTLVKVGLGVGGGLLTLGVGAKLVSNAVNSDDDWIDIEISDTDIQEDLDCDDNPDVEVEIEEISVEEK